MARILLVDDDPGFCASLGEMLTRQGHAVVTKHSARAARSLLETDRDFDVALIDMFMETDTAGLVLVKAMRDMNLPIPRVVVTGHGAIGNAVACMRAGAYDYVEKAECDQNDRIDIVIRRAVALRRLVVEAIPALQALGQPAARYITELDVLMAPMVGDN